MSTAHIASLFPGLRVLVVEDVIALAIQYRTLAAKLQVQTTTAGTMAEALQQVHNGPWHAALVDLKLPDGSGFEVMRAAGLLSGGHYGRRRAGQRRACLGGGGL
jgi:CheY-like chemotaxis protein